MILLALVAKVPAESKLQACKRGVPFHCWFVKTELLALKFYCTVRIHADFVKVLHT